MNKKTFAEVLKENLTSDSFKQKVEKLFPVKNELNENLTSNCFKQKVENLTSNNSIKNELKKYYITENDLKKIYNSIRFYKNLFKPPVKLLFYWQEEDWQGSLFVIYEYKYQLNDIQITKYIYIRGRFGSCEYCDNVPDSNETLDKIFDILSICNQIKEIELPKYAHPELISCFQDFKKNLV